MARLMKKHSLLSMVNGMVIDLPAPANISYLWNFGSLLGVCLVVQIVTGIFLAMHYAAHVDLAFSSVEHIMRDVNYGWLLRYLHANGASMFFVMVYIHIARGLYYGSYTKPRVLLWLVGVIIFFLMMGKKEGFAQNISINNELLAFIKPRVRAHNRIGPHNKDILSILTGSLLGDGTLYNNNGRIRLRLEQKSKDYIYYLWRLLKNLGYAKSQPLENNRKNGNKTYYFYSYTSTSWITLYNEWYPNGKKSLPKNIESYLTLQALAIWIMDDGAVQKDGLIICTQSFTLKENEILCEILKKNFHLDARINKAGIRCHTNTPLYRVRITKSSMESLIKEIEQYMCPSMLYKIKK